MIAWLAVAAGASICWNWLPPPVDPWILDLSKNPDKFFLWTVGTNFDYSFTYDPHAADEWRFEYGVFPISTMPLTNHEK